MADDEMTEQEERGARLRLVVELVAPGADPEELADWLHDTLCDLPDGAVPDVIDSFDGVDWRP